MADHHLIAAQLHTLAARLPHQAVEELADGLHEAYDHHLRRHGDPDLAARQAIADFGDADTVTTAFVRASPWRRTALTLLATGPLMAAAWAPALITAHAWTWPIPLPIKALYGLALLTVAALLATATLTRRTYHRTRTATIAATSGLIVLDGLMVTAATVTVTEPAWPMAVATTASVVRILATLRTLPTALAD